MKQKLNDIRAKEVKDGDRHDDDVIDEYLVAQIKTDSLCNDDDDVIDKYLVDKDRQSMQ